MSANRVLAAALAYIALGFWVFRARARAKTPATTHGFKDAVCDVRAVTEMFEEHSDSNLAIRTGAVSGIAVLDVDPAHGGDESLAKYEMQHGALPVTVECRTGGGGRHFYFRYRGSGLPSRVGFSPGLDVRAEGGYVLAPPSVHPSGTRYRWAPDRAPSQVELAEMPEALEAMIRRPGRSLADRAAAYIAKCEPEAEGERNSHAFKIAGHLRSLTDDEGRVLSDSDIADQLRSWNARNPQPLDDEELLRCVVNSGKHGTQPPPKRPAGGGTSGTSGSASSEEWPDFEPLVDELPPVDPFLPEMLPAAFRAWCVDIAERMQCPLDFLGAALLVALSAVIGRRVGIYPKRKDDWLVVPNLWGGVVGRPSLLKSPSVEEVIRPLKRLEIEAKKQFQKEMKERLAQDMVQQAKAKEAKKEIADAIGAGDEEAALRIANEQTKAAVELPVRTRYMLNDPTIEKLGEILNENPYGVLLFRDELVGFMRAQDKEGHECDRAFYLESWNGSNSFTYDRIGRGTIDIEAACVSIFGCIQPGPLRSYIQAALEFTTADDGFIQRFQVLVWPDVSGEWVNIDRFPDSKAKEAAYVVFLRLAGLNGAHLEVAEVKFPNDGDIPALRFDAPAQKKFDAWRAELELRLRNPQEHPAIEAHLGKYRSLVPSIALIVHLADGGRGPVNEVDIDRALLWAKYLESHARRIYSAGINAEVSAARAIERQLRKKALTDGFTLRDVYRPKWAGLTRREDVDRGIALLVELGWLRSVVKRTAGASTTVYLVNPKLNFGQPSPEGTAKSDTGRTAPPQDADEEVL